MLEDALDLDARRGLEGVYVASSNICFIDGDKGRLIYRGYDISELARNSTYEEVAYLLLFGRLPNRREFIDFKKRLISYRHLPSYIVGLLDYFCKVANPMDTLRTAVSGLSCNQYGFSDTGMEVDMESNYKRAIGLIAKFPTIIAYYHRLRRDLEPIPPDPKLNHAANFLYMLTGETPDEISARAFDMDMILHAEHGFNASTFAARTTVSTNSDIYSAVTAAIGALKGPLHGGAAEETMHMLEEIGYAENAERYVLDKLEKHERVMGFGHRVYNTYDPRAKILKEISRELGEMKKNPRWYELSRKIEETMIREKGLYPNVDFYSASVYRYLNLPVYMYSPIFAIARIAGWTAHCIEQYSGNRLIRPLSKYTGPMGLRYVDISNRW